MTVKQLKKLLKTERQDLEVCVKVDETEFLISIDEVRKDENGNAIVVIH